MATKTESLDSIVLYELWLLGLSLRRIGHRFGVSRTTVLDKIRSVYGRDACNPRCNSLSRTIIQEYGSEYSDLAERARGVPGLYRTTRKEKNLSAFQSLEYVDNYAIDDPCDNEGLRLCLFVWFCDNIMRLLDSLVDVAIDYGQ